MSDLGDDLEKLEGLADKRLSLFGYRFTPTQLGMAVAAISSLVGTLYGGFLMYQKVEEVAGLDVGAYEQQMQLIDQKIDNQQKLLESIETNLRDAKQLTYDVEARMNDKVVYFEGKMEKFESNVDRTKAEIDGKLEKFKSDVNQTKADAEAKMDKFESEADQTKADVENKLDKFERKVDQLKVDLEDKIQKALDNPLAN